MEVEFTARKVKISKALRTQAEEGMERIARVPGQESARQHYLQRSETPADRRA